MEPRITGGEIVIAENSRLTIKVYELEQRIHTLNFDKNKLIHRVEELVNEKDRLETDNNQIHAANENLTQLNDMLKIVLRDAEVEHDHFRAANIKEFDDFILNYIFGLFDNIGILFRFDNQYMRNIINLLRFYNFFNIPIVFHYTKIIYRKFL
ncbi:16503_t:CDS:1 [Racocetra persica]|uniref:16503_t:CDS:1 n=1 Tax=Racocetra persica TaxID=160502 RepID=A0ACA9Q6Z0_9GLOM|nr:16503_t:CDS:1 [Racocetra persica]